MRQNTPPRRVGMNDVQFFMGLQEACPLRFLNCEIVFHFPGVKMSRAETRRDLLYGQNFIKKWYEIQFFL